MERSGVSGGEESLVEGSGLRFKGAVSGEGERSQVEGGGLRWRGEVSGGGEWSQVEGSGQGNDLRLRGASLVEEIKLTWRPLPMLVGAVGLRNLIIFLNFEMQHY